MKKLNPNYIVQKELNQDKWGSWQYNVRDELKPLSVEEIKEHLTHNKLPCAVLMSQIEGDFNFSTIIRTSNNFNIECVYYYGKKRFDRRGTMGTHLYSEVKYLASLEEVVALKNTYQFVALENNVPDCVHIKDFIYPTRPCILLGEENSGLPSELLGMADFTVEIPSRGSVRSLNVASAAAIILYDFYVQKSGADRSA